VARGRQYHEELLVEYLRRHRSAAGKAGRGEAVRWFMNATGASWSTAQAVLKKLKSGERALDVARGRQSRSPRKSEIERARERRDALVVHGVKSRGVRNGKWIPTDRALEMAEDMGLIPKGRYTRSTMDRLLAKYELNYRAAGYEPMAQRLTARYPGHIWLVDATTMDQYYMRLDESVIRYDSPRGDQHLDDYLGKKGLVKIWVYYVVDMYSKAFLPYPVIPLKKNAASKNGGENADDWLDALTFSFLPKRGLVPYLDGYGHPLADCPMEGVPDIIICDRGSGIGNSLRVKSLCRHLGIRIQTHMPGKPSSKGAVETRIGAYKRRFESQLNDGVIKNINQLVHFYQASAHWWNQTQGYYDRWMKGVMNNPIRRVTGGNIHDAMVSRITRTINGFGGVQIDGEDWFITHDGKYRGTKATIFRPPSRNGEMRYIAELNDGTVVDCEKGIPEHDAEKRRVHVKTGGEINRAEGLEVARSIKRMITFDDILPRRDDAGNVVRIPSPARGVETHSPVAPERFASQDHAWRWILNQTGLFKEELSQRNVETIQQILDLAMAQFGHVSSDLVVPFANLLNKNKTDKGANQL
jgi:hypothetical protein